MRTGMVSASLPEGFALPSSRSAAAPPAAWPDSQHSKMAATLCSQVDSWTTEPFASTTISGLAQPGQRIHQAQLVRGQLDVGPVEAFRLRLSRQTQEHHHVVALAGQRDRRFAQRLVVLASGDLEAGGEPDIDAVAQTGTQLIQRHVEPGGVDL